MSTTGIKSQLTVTLAILMTIGMVAINLVVTIFWQRSLIRQEMDKARTALTLAAEMSGKTADGQKSFPGNEDLEGLRQNLDASCVMLDINSETVSVPEKCGPEDAALQEKLIQVLRTGKAEASTIPMGPEIPFFNHRLLITAVPVEIAGGQGAVGAALSLQSVFDEISQGRYIAHVYILVNVIILTSIGLFRLLKVVVRPIEHLVALTNSYRDDDDIPLLPDEGSSEFSRLSLALNSMLQRIDDDRRKLRDTVSSLEKANQQLRATQQQMVQTEKMAAIGRLAAGLAHEIGNPIGIIQGYVELLGQAGVSPEEQQQFSRRSQQELERIQHLIQQLLNFSRTPAHDAGSTRIHPLLQELAGMVQAQKKTAGMEFQLHLGAGQDLVAAGSDSLHQVFLNCLLNAVDAIGEAVQKYGDSHQGIIRLTTANTQDDKGRSSIRITLEDNGIGIREADKDSLFDPFFTTKEPGKGTGLGLSVSYALVETAGGKMGIRGREGHGATVSIELPLAASA